MSLNLPSFADIVRAGYGVSRLLRGDRHAPKYFGETSKKALSSFYTYVLSVPLVTYTAWSSILNTAQTFSIPLTQSTLYFVLRLVIGSLFSLFIAYKFSERLRLRKYFCSYVCMNNWTDFYLTLFLLTLITLFPFDSSLYKYAITLLISLVSLIVVMVAFRLPLLTAAGITLVLITGQECARFLMDLTLLSQLLTPEIVETIQLSQSEK